MYTVVEQSLDVLRDLAEGRIHGLFPFTLGHGDYHGMNMLVRDAPTDNSPTENGPTDNFPTDNCATESAATNTSNADTRNTRPPPPLTIIDWQVEQQPHAIRHAIHCTDRGMIYTLIHCTDKGMIYTMLYTVLTKA
jgi:hypothetical protein